VKNFVVYYVVIDDEGSDKRETMLLKWLSQADECSSKVDQRNYLGTARLRKQLTAQRSHYEFVRTRPPLPMYESCPKSSVSPLPSAGPFQTMCYNIVRRIYKGVSLL
jgi:hypothetical protein